MFEATLTTLGPWATLTFYVTFRFRQEHTAREFVLTGLGIDFQQLHSELITFLNTGVFYRLKAFPIDLRNVEQAVTTRQNLDEATVRHNRTYSAFIDFAYFGDGYDGLDLGYGGFYALLIRR